MFFCWIFAKSEKIPMKDEKIIDIEKLNNSIEPAADLPEVKRKEDGTIDLEAITIEIDEKQNRIIPDDIFNSYYKELPDKVINKSRTWRTAKGGKLKILGGDPEEDKLIQDKGREANASMWVQRRTIREILEDLSRRAASPEDLERLELEQGTTTLEAANYAAIQKAIRGDIKALEYIRDTLGEKPTDKISAEVTALTAEDKELINNISARLAADKNE